MRISIIIVSILCVLLTGCNSTEERLDLSGEKKALLEQHQLQQKAHLEYDVDLVLELMTDEILTVDDGDINYRSQQESRDQFTRYFGSVTFNEWEDLQEPIIKISRDGTLAVAFVKKKVSLYEKGGDPEESLEETQFAWLAVFEKVDGEWKASGFATSRKP